MDDKVVIGPVNLSTEDLPYVANVSAGSIVSIDEITVNSGWAADEADKENKDYNLSCNNARIAAGANLNLLVSDDVQGSIDLGDVLVVNKHTKSGRFKFAIDEPAGFPPLIKDVKYTINGEPEVTSSNFADYVSFDEKRTVNVNPDPVDGIPTDAVTLSVNDSEVPADVDLVSGNQSIALNAKVAEEFNNNGTLTINTTSKNIIKGVTFKFDDNNRKYDEDGKQYVVDNTESVNAIVDDAPISAPYLFAQTVDICVSDEDTVKNPGGKYVYTITYKDSEGKDKTEEVAKEDVVTVPVKGSNTSVSIGVKQVKFDSTVSFNIVSNNLIDEFTVDAFDNDNNKVSSNKVSAKGETASVSFEGASYVMLTGFKLAGAAIDDDEVAIKLNNEIVALYDLAGKKFELNKDGITIDVKAVAKEDKTIYVKNNLDISNSIKSVSYNEIDPDKTDSEIKSAEISDDTVTFKGVLEGNKIKVTGFDLAADYFYLENLTKYNDVKSVNEVVKPDKDGSYDLESVDGSYSINTKTYKLASVKSDGTLSSDSVFNVKKAKNDDPDVTLYISESGHIRKVETADTGLDLPIYALASTETTEVPTLIVTTSENDLRYYSVDSAVIKLGKNTVTAEVTKSSYHDNIYEIKVPYTALYDFFKNAKANDKIDVTLTQTMRGKDQSVSYTENGSSTLSGISDVVLNPRIANGTKIPYGDTLNVRAILKNHYKLKSVSVNGTAVKDSDIALFTGDKGYNIKAEGPVVINFVTEAQANIKVEKQLSSSKTEDITNSTGKYTIDPYNVPVRISYNLGSEPQSIISCNAVNKAKTDVTAKVLNKEARPPYLLFSGAAVSGDSITVTLSANGLAEQTLVFNVAKAGSVKLSKTEDAIPVGGKATYKISKSGSIDYTIGTVSENIYAELSEDGKTLTVKSTELAKDEIGKQYTITLVDIWNPSEVLATLKVKLSDAITDSKAPTATVTNVTSYSMDVKLGTSVDTTIEGLYYKVFVSANTVSAGSALVDSITKYVKVTGKTDNATIDLRKDAYISDETASDASRKYTVTASLIQYNGDPATYDAAKLVAEGKNKTTTKEEKVKEGGIYETRLKLSKIKGSPSNMFANMGINNGDAPFALSVVYSKNTSEQKLARVELLDENGNIIEFIGAENSNGRITANPTGDFLKADDRAIKFWPHKYGTTEELPVGNYVIKAYAQEPKGVEVTAQFKVKVVRAIVSINLVPETEILYKTAGKSAKTSITALDGNTSKKASKVKWSIDFNHSSDDVKSNQGYFKLSNGKLTVDKRFTPKSDNSSKIKIVAQANDWAGNPTHNDLTITISNQTNLALIPTWHRGITDITLNPTKTYYVSELFKDSSTYNRLNKYTADLSFSDRTGDVRVKYTVAGAAKIDKYGEIYFVKPGVMTIKGTALDGSGRKFGPLKINIAAAPKGVTYSLYGFKGNGASATSFAEMDVISSNTVASTGINYGSPSQVLYLDVFGKLDNGNTSYIDTKVKAVGAKVKAVKNHPGLYAVTVTNKKTVLTITYNKNQTADVTFTNAAFNDTKTKVTAANVFWGGAKKAPAGVVYSNIDFSNVGGYTEYNNISVNKVEYTITDNKGGAINGVDTAMVEVVMDKKHEAQKIKVAITDQLDGVNANDNFYYFAVTNGRFAIDYVNNDKTFNIKPGSYNLMITPGKMVDGKFTALGKSFKQKVTFKKAPAAKMKLEKTTLDFGAGGKAGQVSVNIAVKNPSNYINKTKGITFTAEPKSANIKGKINNFYQNFTVVQDATSSRLVFTGTKQNLTTADKNEMSGYITYTYQGYDGRVRSANFKVTIKLKKDGKLSI